MPPDTLTPERILEATEEVLRRYGPAKATVVDVARALGVSHGTIYRHFRTKSALREAVTKRWLDRTTTRLAEVTGAGGPPDELLRRWLETLFEAKRHKAGDDPELFATYKVLTGEHSAVVDAHLDELVGQLARVIEEGTAAGAFAPPSSDPAVTARAVFDATSRFHDPVFAGQWSLPGIDGDLAAVIALVLRGLRPRA